MSADIFSVRAGWLQESPEIGRCRVERARGTEIISFEYNEAWLARHPHFSLGPDVLNMSGRQYPSNNRAFGFLSDTAPDRWGRTLMNRREGIEARKEGRPARKLLESDYILGVHDGGRMGGLRFSDTKGEKYYSESAFMAAPPIAQLRALQDASMQFEQSGGNDEWLRLLLGPGSSLGGARPKANVVDEYGHLWIAKFPSRNDEWNIGAWEAVENELARYCGIRTPQVRAERFSSLGSTFLVSRFDRALKDGVIYRTHMSSAMNELGAQDGESGQYSYLNLVEVIESRSAKIEQDLQELWNRIAFNICTGNTDDHLRNHAFMLSENDSLRLSPAFDMNPDPDKGCLSLNIDFDDTTKDIRKAVEVAPYFRFSESEAIDRIGRMQQQIQRYLPMLQRKYDISEKEQKLMKNAFREAYREINTMSGAVVERKNEIGSKESPMIDNDRGDEF